MISRSHEIPGFVDLQVNGFGGVDFSAPDLTEDGFVDACSRLRDRGTALFLPTLVSCPLETYRRNLPLIAGVMDRPEFKNVIPGFHLEGPFISVKPGECGAHNPAHIRVPDNALFDKLQEFASGKIRLLTIAADAAGAESLACHASGTGVAVSLGHHGARSVDLERLAAAGARALTHLGNGVPAVVDRHANPVWAGLAADNLSAMIITDGHHLPPELIKVIVRTKGASRTIVTSDCAPVAGLPPGTYSAFGSTVVLAENGRLYNPATGYLAGSSATMLECMNYLASLSLFDHNELLRVGFHNPLNLVGLDRGLVRTAYRVCFDREAGRFYIDGSAKA